MSGAATDGVDPPVLGPGRVVLWSLRTEAVAPAQEAAFRGVLSGEERARADRFHFAADRVLYTAAHALLRYALARQGVPDPRFATNAWGKPDLVPDSGTPGTGLRFNLSHTRGLAACALAEGAVGLDVEAGDRVPDVLALAESVFAASETAGLRALPEAARGAAFLRTWTLKEAFIKGVGRGLSMPLADFAFTLDPLSLACAPSLGEGASAWRFRSFPLAPHWCAVALRREAGAAWDAIALDHRILTPSGLASGVGRMVRR